MPLCEPGNQGSYEITRSPPEAIHTVLPRQQVDKFQTFPSPGQQKATRS